MTRGEKTRNIYWHKELRLISIHAHRVKHPKYHLWLIHGYGESQACFEGVFKSPLAQKANIFTFDLPGFGQAPLIPSGYENDIQDLAQIVKAQSPDLPCVILGHSMGGIIAALLAAQLKFERMILIVVDSSLSSDQSPITHEDVQGLESSLFKENLLHRLRAQIPAEPDIMRLVSQVEASDPKALAYWAKEGVHAREHDQVLNLFLNLTCPKYYFIGERSFTLPIRHRLIQLLKNNLIWFSDAGHWIMLDTPQAFWQQVDEFISQNLGENAKTVKALQDAGAGRTHKAKSIEKLFEDLN